MGGSNFWADNPFTNVGEYIDWTEEGQVVEGRVVALEVHTFEANERGPERKVPKLTILDERQNMVNVTCGPADLKKKVVKAQPEVGDQIRIEYVSSNKTALGLQRFFTVKATRPTGPELAALPGDGQLDPAAMDRATAPYGQQSEVPF
jgi:hypothetical protein